MVAARLSVELNDLGKLAGRSKRPAAISSMCVVFAETEIMGLLASGAWRCYYMVLTSMDPLKEQLQRAQHAHWKREERGRLWSRIIRWGTGIPLLFCCFLIPWFGPFLALLGCILIAPDIAGWIVTRLILPYHDGKRQPLYSIPESLVAKGKYEEAEREYEAIMQAFPGEAKPHIGLIEISVMRLNDADLARRLYEQGMGRLRDRGARETLTQAYEAIRTRIRSGDEQAKAVIPGATLDDVRARLERDRKKMWR